MSSLQARSLDQWNYASLSVSLHEEGIHTTLSCPGRPIRRHQASLPPNLQRYYAAIEALLDDPQQDAERIEQHLEVEQSISEDILRVALSDKGIEQLCQLTTERPGLLCLDIATGDPILDELPWELLSSAPVQEQLGCEVVVWRRVGDSARQEMPSTRVVMRVESSALDDQSTKEDAEFAVIERHLQSMGAPQRPRLLAPYRLAEFPQFVVDARKERPSLLHLILHGKAGALGFQMDGDADSIEYPRFVGYIKRVNSLQVVVFSSCVTADASVHQPCLARLLVEAGLPIIIGMPTAVTPRSMVAFSDGFYQSLSLGASVIEAYGEGVRAIRNMDRNRVDRCLWPVPVLYGMDGSESVIPFPRTEWAAFAERVERFVRHIDELRSQLVILHPQPGWSADTWMAESTYIRVRIEDVKTGCTLIERIPISSAPNEVQSGLELQSHRTETEASLDSVHDELQQLTSPELSTRERSDLCRTLQESLPKLIETLDHLRELVTPLYPASVRVRRA